MSKSPEDLPGAWSDRIEKYLDGRLDQDEARRVADSLRKDPDAQESLLRNLLIRGLSDGPGGPVVELPEECRRACDLISGYLAGEIDGADVALLSRHLDSCDGCKVEYESVRDAGEGPHTTNEDNEDLAADDLVSSFRSLLKRMGDSVRPKSLEPPSQYRLPLWIALTIPGAAVAIVCASLLLDPGGSDDPPASPGLILPIPSQELSDLMAAVAGKENDSDPVSEAMERCRRADPDTFRKIAEDPTVRSKVRRIDLGGLSLVDRDRVQFLLAALHDPRLTPGEQSRALEPLRRVLGGRAREFFWHTAENTDQPAIFYNANDVLALGKYRPHEGDRLRAMFDLAVRNRFDNGIGALIDYLALLGHPETPDLCLGILSGRYGTLKSPCQQAASKLIACARKHGREDLLRQAEEIAMSGRDPYCRLITLRALWREDHSPRWDSEILRFADHPDSSLRIQVAHHLESVSNPEHLPVIDTMLADSNLGVRQVAGRALKRMTGEVPERKLR